MGGLGTSSTFKANIEALGKIRFNMRTMHDVSEPDTSTELLGFKLDLPLFAAPIGGVSFNMGGKITEDEYISAILKGCVSKGLIGCTGDGVPEFIHQSAFKAIREVEGNAIPFIKPWESEEFEDKLAKALDAGAKAFGMDIDAAGLITLKKMGRPVTPKGKEKLAEIISRIPVPFVLKGIMTADEALMAAEAGAAGIVVSNHGGRVLDHCPGTAEVLAEISRAVNGKCSVIVDGGTYSMKFPKMSQQLLEKKIEHVKATGADVLLTDCPGCVMQLRGGAKKMGLDIEVRHIAEALAERKK
jgi:isopentenyl diphosphate isomerase/L-lactate dehydrogenase-like FMN-dependent dehydrogenase